MAHLNSLTTDCALGGTKLRYSLNQGNVKLLASSPDGVFVQKSVNRETTANIQIRNSCSAWVVYQVKTTTPNFLLLRPHSYGVLAPKDVQPLQLILLAGHDFTTDYQILIESALVPKDNVKHKTICASNIFRTVLKNNITQSVIPLKVVSSVANPSDVFFVYFKEPGENLPMSSKEVVKKVVDRLKSDNLYTQAKTFLCLFITVGFLFGFVK